MKSHNLGLEIDTGCITHPPMLSLTKRTDSGEPALQYKSPQRGKGTADNGLAANDINHAPRGKLPAFHQLMRSKATELSSIIVNVLSRSLRELLETVDNLKSRGIHLVSLEERLDTSSAAGELVFHVFGAIAHFERRLISERTRDGIAAARKRGRNPGRPPLDPDTVSAARKLVQSGLSPTQAAKHLGIGRATVYRITKQQR